MLIIFLKFWFLHIHNRQLILYLPHHFLSSTFHSTGLTSSQYQLEQTGITSPLSFTCNLLMMFSAPGLLCRMLAKDGLETWQFRITLGHSPSLVCEEVKRKYERGCSVLRHATLRHKSFLCACIRECVWNVNKMHCLFFQKVKWDKRSSKFSEICKVALWQESIPKAAFFKDQNIYSRLYLSLKGYTLLRSCAILN